MDNKALGIFETFGFSAAVAGADAAVKSAEVELLGCHFIGAGLVSVLLAGDVSSVKVGVDAGCHAADQVGRVTSCTVIARTAQGLGTLLDPAPPGRERSGRNQLPGRHSSPGNPPSAAARPEEDPVEPDVRQLYQMHVGELRALARQLPELSLDRPQIRSARKDQLITAIVNFYQKQKE